MEGLYVLLTENGGLKELAEAVKLTGQPCVLVKCLVDPANYIHSSERNYDGRGCRTATYYALTPIELVTVHAKGYSKNPVLKKAVKALKAYKQPKVKK